MLWSICLKILSRFDAEKLHHLSFRLLRALPRMGVPLRLLSGARDAPAGFAAPAAWASLPFATLFPVGLAAGFDKNAEILDLLPALGFGFAEIGTITPRPQAGNPKPRLFRDYGERKIFNRMGFNNHGMEVIARRLEALRPALPKAFAVGVNLGKNKDTPDEDAARDYAAVALRFAGLADYFVINVSSPNTPGLRRLQAPEFLVPILKRTKEAAGATPVFVKLAPEIQGDELAGLLGILGENGADGFVLGNTLGGEHAGQAGGWSGAPLATRAEANLATARAATRLPLISVGGILSGADARKRLERGAQAVQIYSGWIMRGPRLPTEIREALEGELRRTRS